MSERKPAFDHVQREQIAERHLARLKLEMAVAFAARRERRVQHPGLLLALRQHHQRDAARGRADQAHGELPEAPLQPVAAIVRP